MALHWVAVNGGSIPSNAVSSGYDTNGERLYVARAEHNGGILPGKLIASKNYALICTNRREHWKYQYDVLVGTNYKWIESSNGFVPENAVVGGYSMAGETLYVGRGHYNNSMQPGKIHPSNNCLYFPYNGNEIQLFHYETLCHYTPPPPPPPRSKWIQSNIDSPIPAGAHVGGNDIDGTPIYIGRATYGGDLLPVSIIPSKRKAYLTNAGQEIEVNSYEVLCEGRIDWVTYNDGNIPEGAVSSGNTRSGAQIYIGRGNYMESLSVGRIDPTNKTLHIPIMGCEIAIDVFEILVEP